MQPDDAQRYLNCDLATDDEFSRAALQLHNHLGIRRATIITRGARGATLAANGDTAHCPAPSVSDVFDTVGAGDTAIATLTLAIGGGTGGERRRYARQLRQRHCRSLFRQLHADFGRTHQQH